MSHESKKKDFNKLIALCILVVLGTFPLSIILLFILALIVVISPILVAFIPFYTLNKIHRRKLNYKLRNEAKQPTYSNLRPIDFEKPQRSNRPNDKSYGKLYKKGIFRFLNAIRRRNA